MDRLVEIMSGRFGRFPTAEEIEELKTGGDEAAGRRLDALLAIEKAGGELCRTVADQTCLLLGRADFQPHAGASHLSPEEMDALPFGVIGVDAEDVVRIYNLWESDFSALEPEDVIGKNWFREVAPCTQVEEFEGRFRGFVARDGGEPGEPTLPFDFAFDLKAGRRKVSVTLLPATTEGLRLIAVTLPYVGCVRDTRILLRFLSLAMATGDVESFGAQVETWYVEFLSNIGIPPGEVYLNMSNLGDKLPAHFDPDTVSALRAPLMTALKIVEAAMVQTPRENAASDDGTD